MFIQMVIQFNSPLEEIKNYFSPAPLGPINIVSPRCWGSKSIKLELYSETLSCTYFIPVLKLLKASMNEKQTIIFSLLNHYYDFSPHNPIPVFRYFDSFPTTCFVCSHQAGIYFMCVKPEQGWWWQIFCVNVKFRLYVSVWLCQLVIRDL